MPNGAAKCKAKKASGKASPRGRAKGKAIPKGKAEGKAIPKSQPATSRKRKGAPPPTRPNMPRTDCTTEWWGGNILPSKSNGGLEVLLGR